MKQVKAAHASRRQKAVGQINAAGEALAQAWWWLGADDECLGELEQLIRITNMIKTKIEEGE